LIDIKGKLPLHSGCRDRAGHRKPQRAELVLIWIKAKVGDPRKPRGSSGSVRPFASSTSGDGHACR
jgi:hypothetical protein